MADTISDSVNNAQADAQSINSNNTIIIAIAGASASGKSLIASTIHKELCEEVGGDDIGIISEDAYYKDQSHLSFEQRIQTNYDHPSSMDHDLLVSHLRQLKCGETIHVPEYSYVEHTRTGNNREFKARRVIILEGILLLTDERLRNELSASIFVSAVYNGICKNVDVVWNRWYRNIAKRYDQCFYNLFSRQNSSLILLCHAVEKIGLQSTF